MPVQPLVAQTYQKYDQLSGTGHDEEARYFRSWIEYDSNWPTFCTYNPEIDPQVVFEIYRQSI